jgi:DNA-binding NtrC family response regulator
MPGQAQSAVLVADDDAALRLVCRVNLEFEGYRVFEAANAAAVHEILRDETVHAVLLDVHLGSDNGLAVARELRETRPDLGVALFSGTGQRPSNTDELADGFLPKPFELSALSDTVRRLVDVSR